MYVHMQRLNTHKYRHVLKLNKLDKTIIMSHDKYILSFQVLFDFRHSIKLNLSKTRFIREKMFTQRILIQLFNHGTSI